MKKIDESGVWEVQLPENVLKHGDLYRLKMCWDRGEEDRIPAYARRVTQRRLKELKDGKAIGIHG